MPNYGTDILEQHWVYTISIIFLLISQFVLIFVLIFNSRKHKRVELELRESEDRFKSIFENSPDGILLADIENKRFHASNKSICEMLGYSREEIRGLGVPDIHPEKDLAYVIDCIERQLSGEITLAIDIPVKRKDGAVFYADVNSFVMTLSGRKYLVGSFRDITDSKLADDALVLSESKYRLLFENMTTGFALHEMIYDGQGRPADYRFLEINPAFEKLTGVSAADLLGRTVKEAMPATEQYWIDVYGRVAQTGEPTAYQNYSKELGRYYDVWAFSPMKDRFAVVFTDVTPRKMAEEALKESERRFRETLENANLIAVQLDREGNITFANNFFAKLTGWDIKGIAGKNWTDLFIPDDIRAQIKELHAQNILEKEIVQKYENDILTKAGEKRLIAWTNSHMFGPNEEITGITSLGIDITEHRRLEEQLRNIQKLEAVGTLAGGIAHDFNNLLQGIFGYLSMARISIDNRDKALSMLEQAEKALHLSVKLTSQLLTFTKGGKPEKKLIKLGPLIENSARFALSGSNCSCVSDIAESLRPVNADEGQISQVVQNIVLNADQAMPLGGTIEISARNVESGDSVLPAILEKGEYAAISIRDTGIGIPEEYLPRIFDLYFTTKEKGSGLGLATSYSIIKNHGGTIDVSSKAGKGTVFTVYIPATEASAEDAAAPVVRTSKKTGRVLVMDDEEVIRDVARELLAALGHETEVAGRGEEALGIYKAAKDSARPFDIVILDLTIRGGMGGSETLKRMKVIDPEVKAIVSSGYSEDSSMEDYKKQGFAASLKKPYDINKLKSILDEVLS
ncbi:MAG: PAS domain S-box protein [Nitrospirae bacterium]|nr:MAG: PAS domain S-box protein [Nitrospirota bacterium]